MKNTEKRGHKVLKVIAIVFSVIVILIVLLIVKIFYDAKLRQKDQEMMVKSDDELIGEHLYINRDGADDVDVNLYRYESDEPVPLVINLHGGAFVAGDADTLDTQSERISKAWCCTVVTVNYKLMKDGITKQYAVDEVKDTVKYMTVNADEYNIDTDNIFILGYSAGGYHAMAAALQLHKEGVIVKGQILCYPFISDILEQYNGLTDEQKKTTPPALFILAGDEPIGKGSLDYKSALDENGVPTELITYDGALHGFIEENNLEYEDLHFHDSRSPEQEKMARQAENDILAWLGKIAIISS
ncbi:MAG: alpha/beta hydrolase [Ruminococcus sp.]|nr:alpha/beta hydrolase [Ruminococcus sp.]